jgi:hypothetical protein
VVAGIGVHLGWVCWAGPKHGKKARHDPKYFSAGPGTARYFGPGLGRGHGPWAATSTTRLRQARNDPYRGTERPIYLLKPHFISHFHILDKEHKARDNAS